MKVLAAILLLLPLTGYAQLIIQPPPPTEERVIANVEDQIMGAMQDQFAPLTPTSSTILQTSAGTGIISWDELGIYGWNFIESESGLFGSLQVGGRHGLLFDGENGTVSWGDKALWFDDSLLIGRWAFEDTVITPDIEINGDIDLQGSISSYVHPHGVSTSLYDPGYDDRPTFLPGWQHGIGIGGWTENDTELAARRLYGNWNVTHSLHVERTSSAARVQTPVIELQRPGIGPPQTWSERAELTLLNGDIYMHWRDVDGDHKNIRLGQDRYAPLTHFGIEDGIATVPGDLIVQSTLTASSFSLNGETLSSWPDGYLPKRSYSMTFAHNNHNPAAGTSQPYHFDQSIDLAPVTEASAARRGFVFPFDVRITSASVVSRIGNQTASGQNAPVQFFIRTPDNVNHNLGIQADRYDTQMAQTYVSTGLDIGVNAGDTCRLYYLNPTWATAPTAVRHTVTIYFEER